MTGLASLHLAKGQSEYLDKHKIPELLCQWVKQLMEQQPADPLSFLEQRLAEQRGKHQEKLAPDGVATPQEKSKRDAAAVEDMMLAVALAAKGAIGPAVVEEAACKARVEQCDHALERFDAERGAGHYFAAKLEVTRDNNHDMEQAAEKRVEEARRQFAGLVPDLARRVAPELKRTEALYWEELQRVMEREPGTLAELEAFTERFNSGSFSGAGAEVQVVLAGRFDFHGKFTQDSSLDRQLLRARLVTGVIEDGKIEVELFFEQLDAEVEYEAGFTRLDKDTSSRIMVERRLVYGGQKSLEQPLSSGVAPTSLEAFFEVYEVAERTLPKLVKEVEAAIAVAAAAVCTRKDGVKADIQLKLAPLKAHQRAATKVAEKYALKFNRLLDVARMTVVCATLAELVAVLRAIDASDVVRIVRMKNRMNPLFPADESAGYRDVLLNVVLVETKCVCEVQVTLSAFVAIKKGGGHGAYKIGRAIGTDRSEETTHAGDLNPEVIRRVAAGLTQRLVLEGTAIPPKHLQALVGPDGLAAATMRLVELRMGACSGLAGKDLAKLLSKDACVAMGSTIRLIDLTGTGISGQLGGIMLPDHCTKLETLMLCNNKLSGSISEAFSRLRRLRVLRLSFNKLGGKIPAALGDLSELAVLELQKCELNGVIPQTLGQLSKLHEIYLNDNKLSGKLPKEFGQLQAARIMYLQNNKLEGAIPEELAQLFNLEQLDLSGNQISPKDSKRFAELLRSNSLMQKCTFNGEDATSPLGMTRSSLCSSGDQSDEEEGDEAEQDEEVEEHENDED